MEGLSVLVLKEEHSDQYFVVNNETDLYAVALLILRGRLKAGVYCDPGPPPPADLGLTREDAERLPKAFQGEAILRIRRHEDGLRLHALEKAEWDEINLACSSADGKAAWLLLRCRSNHEYESVRLEPVRNDRYDP